MLNVKEALEKYHTFEQRIHRSHGIKITVATISNSLLLAAKIHSGEIDLNRIDLEQFLLLRG
ncbi:MAG: hypothetical protein WC565_08265 [Parcubacteria group bacterium]|jgi:hypothetical protein